MLVDAAAAQSHYCCGLSPVVVAGRDQIRLSTPVARVVLRCGQTLCNMSLMLVTMCAILDGIVDLAIGCSENTYAG